MELRQVLFDESTLNKIKNGDFLFFFQFLKKIFSELLNLRTICKKISNECSSDISLFHHLQQTEREYFIFISKLENDILHLKLVYLEY